MISKRERVKQNKIDSREKNIFDEIFEKKLVLDYDFLLKDMPSFPQNKTEYRKLISLVMHTFDWLCNIIFKHTHTRASCVIIFMYL